MRVQARPRFRAAATAQFPSFEAGAEAVRALSQSGLWPSNCRLLDPGEAELMAGAPPGRAVLVLGFESADHPLDPWIARAVECCRDLGGDVVDGPTTSVSGTGAREGEAGAWRNAFVQAPYLRDTLIAGGVLSETFETAITWDRLPGFVDTVLGATRAAVGEPAIVTCRLTHAYPDGAAPYFTVLAEAGPDPEARWHAVKAAATEAILAGGGTITHHHAVGRDHRDAYAAQRPGPFGVALRAARDALDPSGVLNPGVLFEA
jgi:alkyldihydroxyacetonephosphate synthase